MIKPTVPCFPWNTGAPSSGRSSPSFICHETRDLPGSCGTNWTIAHGVFLLLSCYLNENCLWVSEAGPWMLLVTCLISWAPFLSIAKSASDSGGTFAAAITVLSVVSSDGCISTRVPLHLAHQFSFPSSTCSGVCEMPCPSVQLLTVTNTCLAEKPKC